MQQLMKHGLGNGFRVMFDLYLAFKDERSLKEQGHPQASSGKVSSLLLIPSSSHCGSRISFWLKRADRIQSRLPHAMACRQTGHDDLVRSELCQIFPGRTKSAPNYLSLDILTIWRCRHQICGHETLSGKVSTCSGFRGWDIIQVGVP